MDTIQHHTFELSNYQRSYFGLLPVQDSWEKVLLSDTIAVYFDPENTIVKVFDYGWGYQEYDTRIHTIDRQILLPLTSRGKQQKLTVPRVKKINPQGIQFSGSFQGGNIHVYDPGRKVFFIESYPEDGDMRSYADIEHWIQKYVTSAPPDYFKWLASELSQKRQRIAIKAGNIISFRLSKTEFGFARILANVYEDIINSVSGNERYRLFHRRSLIVAPYIFLVQYTASEP